MPGEPQIVVPPSGAAAAPAPAAPSAAAPAGAPSPALAAAPSAPVASPAAVPAAPSSPVPAPAPGQAAAPAPGAQKPVPPSPGQAALEELYKDPVLADPQGVTVDPQAKGAFAAWLKEHKVPQEQAQLFYEYGLKFGSDMLSKMQASATAAFQARVQEMRREVESDPDVGGPRLQASTAARDRFLAAFGGQVLRDRLEQLGLMYEPTLFKVLARAGAAITEDTVAGSISPAGPRGASAEPSSPAAQARALGYHKMAEQLESRGGGARR